MQIKSQQFVDADFCKQESRRRYMIKFLQKNENHNNNYRLKTVNLRKNKENQVDYTKT